jgi:hypothetical protein
MYTFRWRVRVSSWWRKIKEHRQRKVRAEIDRILGGISESFYTPLQPPPPVLRMRILEYCRQWWEETAPRTPEGVAFATYEYLRR